ncbi:S24 family peptidase [Burkholderia gladioli]|uniref:S24 family peptidase n=1 Tax=Burkholderia gladioli TaxID=28095 RepID=UPI0016413BC2|nr:S24 family peptidase [Burkholderia gladioli]
MEISEIRLANMRHLSRQEESAAAFARRLGMAYALLQNYIGKTPTKKIGDKTARNVERVLGLPIGWMDLRRDDYGEEVREESKASATQGDTVLIPRFAIGGSMGHGLELRDQPGMIETLRVNKEWLSKNLRHYSSVHNLCLVTGFGDSMRPMFNPGDPLIVDIGVREVVGDAIYFFRIGNEGFIKRLQRIPTAAGLLIRAKSENPAYDTWNITRDMEFEVLGRVLKVWRSEDF